MTKLLWKLYYRALYGKNYAVRISDASFFCRAILPMNAVNYTVHGDIIRERVTWQPRYNPTHPLVKKYSNKQ